MHADSSWHWLDSPRLPWLVAILAVALLLGRLDAPLLEPQEARYAEIPRQMLAEHSLLVPVLHGEAYLDKPPLFYWCVLAGYSVLGVADHVARLVPGFAGLGVVLIVAWWGRLARPRLGMLAALVLLLCPRFLYQQRQLTMDCLLCLWTTLALAAALRATRDATLHRGWWLVVGLACGLGLLTKGPIVFVLVVPALLVLRVSLMSLVSLGLVAGCVALPWFVAVSAWQPDFLADFFWRHHVERFATPFDHAKPAWYYLPGLLLGLMPWALLIPAMAMKRSEWSRDFVFALVAGVWPIVFFSLSGCKRPLYLLPALPPLAIVFASTLLDLSQRRILDWLPVLCIVGVLGGVIACGVTGMLLPMTVCVLAAVLVTLVGIAIRQRQDQAIGFGLMATAFVLGVTVLLPAYTDAFGLGTLPPGETSQRVLCYPQRFDSASFYLPQAEVRVFGSDQREAMAATAGEHPGTLLFVRSGRPLKELLATWPETIPLETIRPRGLVVVFRVGEVRAAGRGPRAPGSPG